MREAILKYVRNAVQMKSHLPQHDQGRNPLNQLLQMALLFDKSELQCRAYLVAALCLHDAVFFRHDTGCTQGGEHGLQGKVGRVILLREMAQSELFTAALDELQKLCGALVESG